MSADHGGTVQAKSSLFWCGLSLFGNTCGNEVHQIESGSGRLILAPIEHRFQPFSIFAFFRSLLLLVLAIFEDTGVMFEWLSGSDFSTLKGCRCS